MGRVFLSAIVLIITNLIIGSISLSLGLIAVVLLVGALVIAILLFAVLGVCITMEKAGWLSPGWTDRKMTSLKDWTKRKWHDLPGWYKRSKKRIIEMLVETLQSEEQATEGIKIWKSAVIGLIILLAIILVKQALQLSIGWSIVIVAIGSVFVTVPVMYVMSGKQKSETPAVQSRPQSASLASTSDLRATDEELTEALKVLVELQRTGRLQRLLESPMPEHSSSDAIPLGKRDADQEPHQ